jgi:hypothetical protein
VGYDRRYDFGLVALKQRDSRGRWHDVMRPRPSTRGHTHDSAGPVLDVDGTRFLAHGTSISVEPGGVVSVRGGFQNQEGEFLRRGVTFRFAPVRDGVRMTFPLRAGDVARVTAFMPDGEVRRRGATIFDARSSAVVSPAPSSFRFLARGLASCCDASIIEASALFRAPSNRTYSYTVRAAGGPPAGAAAVPIQRHREPTDDEGDGGGGSKAWWLLAIPALLLPAAVVLRRRAKRRRVRR